MKIIVDASAEDSNNDTTELHTTSVSEDVKDVGDTESDKEDEGYEEDEGDGDDIFEEHDTTHDGMFYMSLFNNFMIHHNNTNATTKHMFDGIDYKDDTSTTFTMESFYRAMSTYNDNKAHNCEKIKLIEPKNDYELADATDMYCLKVDNNIHYYCQDIFALLIDVTEKQYGNWKIDTLR